ncbi:MAG TPA: hypothetical protein VD999_03890 [Vitreimonas sp.]|nr:hypothetical protein [Vitreimonas sp.]
MTVKQYETDSLVVTLFSSFLALTILGSFLFFTTGIENYFFSAIKVFMMTLYLINQSHSHWLSTHNNAIRSNTLYILSIVSLSLIGLFLPAPVSMLIVGIMFIRGGVLFARNLLTWWRSNSFKSVLLLIFLALVMGVWIFTAGALSNTFNFLLPHKILAGTAHPDTVFYTALTNRLRYQLYPTTGLDGLVWTPYHFGSHLLFAGIAQLLQIKTVFFYQFGFHGMIVSLFVHALLKLGLYFKHQLIREKNVPLAHNTSWWLLFFSIIIGLLPTAISNRIGVVDIFLFNESYTVANTFSFLLIPIVVPIILAVINQQFSKSLLLNLALLLGALSCLALIKLSHLYLALVVLGYLTLRLQLYKKIFFVLFMMSLAGVGMIGIVFFNLPEHSIFFEPFFYLHFIDQKLVWLWLAYGFITTWLYGFITYIQQLPLTKAKLKKAFKSYQFLTLEVVMVLLLGGLLPSLVFNTRSFSNYLLDYHRWVALSLLLVTSNTLFNNASQLLNQLSSRFLHLTLTQSQVTNLIKLLLISILTIKITANLVTFYHTYQLEITSLASAQDTKLSMQTRELEKLHLYTPLSAAAVYLPPDSNLWSINGRCYISSLMISALSELPILANQSLINCETDYPGLSLYQPTELPAAKSLTDDELCDYAKQRHITKIIKLYDSQPELLNCNNPT